MKLAEEHSPQPRVVTVDAEQDGQRIDNFLLRHMKGVPRSHVYRILRRGEVRVNKGRIRAGYRLRSGDRVRIPPVRQAAPRTAPRPPHGLLQRLEQAILYEDADLMVLDKPAGIAVHGGSGLQFGIIESLRVLRPDEPLELVHRLDRDTSGCLLVAKRREALLDLQAQLRAGELHKRYLALILGDWKGGRRTVSAPLRKNVVRGGERVVRVSERGKVATSVFSPVARLSGATLMEVELTTGRTHQIRVHAAEVGHPLAGDPKYGSAEFNRRMRRYGLKRLFLHAYALGFRRPASGKELYISAPLDPALQRVLDRLEGET
ncbi:MAG: 23S rRNA pseudouridine(955/2504/2580) synthase RluC [Gammaproteobacteria bacterium]|nr:23S rRNA pseudouridine(955/2504/2580) synthase RluC [Gammaproteobacteria bacterium]NIR96687.1 23S rRNA pseudouridine(955/2504/2580) synthase RluC [Gammaproteobacteria bacterium]NIT62391.1 23S rRNA pseudouridine(955/2504/2580) synthase RluC [Gammaproteobacteria bacterium]NIV19323.1 23S rRNA pseudouridine(955/2504/2580) synthase RluC [Gammaproteobacteria bacterium]NIX10284.1 23S rRNA pseudouridine(955/2504/2580) synthase RluC [Gammaproteobacteria bacterium]